MPPCFSLTRAADFCYLRFRRFHCMRHADIYADAITPCLRFRYYADMLLILLFTLIDAYAIV